MNTSLTQKRTPQYNTYRSKYADNAARAKAQRQRNLMNGLNSVELSEYLQRWKR